MPATYQEGDSVMVHHSRLFAWPRSTIDDPYFGPYKIPPVDGHRIIVRCCPRLGGTQVCAAQQLKHNYNPEELCGGGSELNNEEIDALDLQGAASQMEFEGELPNMNAEEMASTWCSLSSDTVIAKGSKFSPSRKVLTWRKLPGNPLLPLCRRWAFRPRSG